MTPRPPSRSNPSRRWEAPDPDPLWVDGYQSGMEDMLMFPRSRRPVLIALIGAALSGAIVGALLTAAIVHASPRPAPEVVVPASTPTLPGASHDAGRKSLWATEAAAGLSSAGTGGAPTSSPAAAPPPSSATSSLSGVASWYRASGLIAAAGPGLRTGDWRGRLVTVTAGGRSVRVVLADWCACPRRLIDLSDDAFVRLAPLSVGLLRVTVERGGPSVTPPPTSTEGQP